MPRLTAPAMPRFATTARRRGQLGMSLVETLIATALLLFISVALFPLFHRSVASNISGADSTQATQHSRSELERVLAVPFDSPYFAMSTTEILGDENEFVSTVRSDGSTDNFLFLGKNGFFFDAEANADAPATGEELVHHLASGAWVENPTWESLCKEPFPPYKDTSTTSSSTSLPPGLDLTRVMWCRSSAVRQYSYSDVGAGVIDVTNPGEIVSGGHPQLFDLPLARDTAVNRIHFRETGVHTQSLRPGTPALYTRHVRTY